ncbi:GNAT family N-acetyltransferase [Dethiothermospora halolimnae]|uniref:GNAT family N-acetyltransferase n=1 Tax=Dethiothermospora halolimnae TaxID=3114390 RepID=UPI003CCBB2CA
MCIDIKNSKGNNMIELNKRNLFNTYKLFTDSGLNILVKEEDINWIVKNNSSWPNYIFNTNFEKNNISSRIGDMKGKIKSNKAPNYWVVAPNSKTENLEKHLQKEGFNAVTSWSCMGANYKDIKKDFDKPNDLIIETVSSREKLEDWSKVIGDCDVDGLDRLSYNEKVKFYIGYINEKIVGYSMMVLSNEVAGLYMIGVLPDYRNQGIGKAMTIKPILDAKNMGYTTSVLQATETGERIYRQIGFKEYSRYKIYKYEEN